MKIHAFNFSCDRDQELSVMMVNSLYRHCEKLTRLMVYNTDHDEKVKGYGNGSGWPQSMLKLNAIREMEFDNDDYILSVDSDVVFCSRDVFIQIDGKYGIYGTKHKPNYQTRLGPWSHMSGALIFIRGDIARKMCAMPTHDLDMIRFNHFKPYSLTENEDVVLSYLASYCGAEQFDLPGFLSSGNFESDVKNNELRSFYHLNYCPTQFLGEPVTGKWDIPKVLKDKNIPLL